MALRPDNIIWRNRSWRTGRFISAHNTHAHVEHHDQKTLIAIGNWIQQQGGRVSQHEAFGGVDRVHSRTSLHYTKPSQALDVNLGYGNPPGEGAFLDRIMGELWRGTSTPAKPPSLPAVRRFLMALSDQQQKEVHQWMGDTHRKVNEIHDALLNTKDPGTVHRVKGDLHDLLMRIVRKVGA